MYIYLKKLKIVFLGLLVNFLIGYFWRNFRDLWGKKKDFNYGFCVVGKLFLL